MKLVISLFIVTVVVQALPRTVDGNQEVEDDLKSRELSDLENFLFQRDSPEEEDDQVDDLSFPSLEKPRTVDHNQEVRNLLDARELFEEGNFLDERGLPEDDEEARELFEERNSLDERGLPEDDEVEDDLPEDLDNVEARREVEEFERDLASLEWTQDMKRAALPRGFCRIFEKGTKERRRCIKFMRKQNKPPIRKVY